MKKFHTEKYISGDNVLNGLLSLLCCVPSQSLKLYALPRKKKSIFAFSESLCIKLSLFAPYSWIGNCLLHAGMTLQFPIHECEWYS